MKHHRMKSRNRNSQHGAYAFDIIAGGKPVTLRQIPKPLFARSLGLVSTIEYPEGELAVLCGCNVGQPEAIFGCFRCDCGEKTWFAATASLEKGGEPTSAFDRHGALSSETGAA